MNQSITEQINMWLEINRMDLQKGITEPQEEMLKEKIIEITKEKIMENL